MVKSEIVFRSFPRFSAVIPTLPLRNFRSFRFFRGPPPLAFQFPIRNIRLSRGS